MKLNSWKNHSPIITRSKSRFPDHPDIFLKKPWSEIVNLKKLQSAALKLNLDTKATFESHLLLVALSISHEISLLRNCKKRPSNGNKKKKSCLHYEQLRVAHGAFDLYSVRTFYQGHLDVTFPM